LRRILVYAPSSKKTENEMAVRDSFEHFLTQPLPEFHYPFLMTRWTEVPPFTGKREQKLMTTVTAPHSSKAVVEDATIKITVNNLLHIWPKKTVLLGKTLIIDLLKRLEMVFNALVILRILRLARTINRRRVGHG